MHSAGKWLSFAATIGVAEWSLWLLYKFIRDANGLFYEIGAYRMLGPVSFLFGAVYLGLVSLLGIAAFRWHAKEPKGSFGMDIFSVVCLIPAFYVALSEFKADIPFSRWIFFSFILPVMFGLAAALKIMDYLSYPVEARKKLFYAKTDKQPAETKPISYYKISGWKLPRGWTIFLLTLILSGVAWGWLLGYFDHQYEPQRVVNAFQAADLPVESSRPITQGDYYYGKNDVAPLDGVNGLYFKLEARNVYSARSGFVVTFNNNIEMEQVRNYFYSGGRGTLSKCWQTMNKGNTLVVIEFLCGVYYPDAFQKVLQKL